MKKLNLPIIKGKLPPKKVLSMDDYFKFVKFNCQYGLEKKSIHNQEKKVCKCSF